jgi:hypothetical protein
MVGLLHPRRTKKNPIIARFEIQRYLSLRIEIKKRKRGSGLT